jgi:ABC-type lipoprotein export system ATPase subunit
MLMVTHDPDAAAIAGRSLLLEHGKLTELKESQAALKERRLRLANR